MEEKLRAHLQRIADGEKPPMTIIGHFTDDQFGAINAGRKEADLHLLEKNEIIFMGRHLYTSRSRDGYNVDDMVKQIVSGMSSESVVDLNKLASRMQSATARDDGYGNQVFDRIIFEMTAQKPRAELFSVMPKGDSVKPNGTRFEPNKKGYRKGSP
jgi:hypothetical protein